MGSIKVTRDAARKLVRDGYTIKLIPSRIRLKNLWMEPAFMSKDILEKNDSDFEKFVNEYSYYNCNNAEVGYYPAFYIHVDFTLAGYTDSALGYRQALKKYTELEKEHEDFNNA